MNKTLHSFPKRQSGVAVMIALVVLVVMTLAGIAVVRSVDAGALIAGNLAFRKSATNAADIAMETARTWLLANTGILTNDNGGAGYWANSANNLDLTGNITPANSADDVAWPDTAGVGNPFQPSCLARDAVTGNRACFIINRLCDVSGGPLDSSTCATMVGTRGGNSQGGVRQASTNQEGGWTSTTSHGYYRITVRIDGPRNTVSFAQTYVII
jgi:type IV pilus assembly protein PilX